MYTIYALLLHAVVGLCSFSFSLRLLERRNLREGAISSFAAGIALVVLGAGYFVFRTPRFFFTSTTVSQSDRVAIYYVCGGVIFLAHFLFLALQKSKPSEPSSLESECGGKDGKKKSPTNHQSQCR